MCCCRLTKRSAWRRGADQLSRKRRNLSEEERALWNKVAGTATPLNRAPINLPDHNPRLPEPKPTSGPKPAIPPFRMGQSAQSASMPNNLAPSPAQQLRQAPVQMHKGAYQKMTRGKLAPEARLDLHGMTLAQAQPALTGFVLRAANEGRRLVLVITGKGRDKGEEWPLPTRPGALRHAVPHWLHSAPLAGLVLQVTPAHQRHGGDGAYYVYLRRAR